MNLCKVCFLSALSITTCTTSTMQADGFTEECLAELIKRGFVKCVDYAPEWGYLSEYVQDPSHMTYLSLSCFPENKELQASFETVFTDPDFPVGLSIGSGLGYFLIPNGITVDNCISRKGWECLKKILSEEQCNVKELQILPIYESQVPPEDFFEILERNKSIEMLSIYWNHFVQKHFDNLGRALQNNRTLLNLGLSGAKEFNLDPVIRALEHSSIRALKLTNCESINLETLFKANHHLAVIFLRQINKIDEWLKNLCGTTSSSPLKEYRWPAILGLEDCGITSKEGFEFLWKLLPQIEVLDLDRNFIGDEGAKSLAKAISGLKDTKSRRLYLSKGIRMTEDGVKTLLEAIGENLGAVYLTLSGSNFCGSCGVEDRAPYYGGLCVECWKITPRSLCPRCRSARREHPKFSLCEECWLKDDESLCRRCRKNHIEQKNHSSRTFCSECQKAMRK